MEATERARTERLLLHGRQRQWLGYLHEVVELIDARALGLRFGLWATQNRFFEIWRGQRDARPRLVPLGAALGFKLKVEVP